MPPNPLLTVPPLAQPGGAQPNVNLLGHLDTLEVSLVTVGANGRPFALAKSAAKPAAPGAPVSTPAAKPVEKGYIDPFAPVSPLEEKLLAAAGGDKLTEKGREAVLLAARCVASAGAELKAEAAMSVLGGLLGIAPAPAAPPAAEPAAKSVKKSDDEAKPEDKPAEPPPAATTKETTTTTSSKETTTPTPAPAAPAKEEPKPPPAQPAAPPEEGAAKDGNQPAAPPAKEGEQPATSPTASPVACASCKAENATDAAACKACGAAMKSAPDATTPAPTQTRESEPAAKDATSSDVHVPATEDKKEPAAKSAGDGSPIVGVSKAAFDALPDNVKKAFADVQKKAADAEKVLKAAAFANVRKAFVEKAAAWKSLGVNADSTGELLHQLSERAPDLAPRVEALIAKAATAITKSGLLNESGTSPASGEVASDNPLEEVEVLAKAAVAKAAADGKPMSIEKARDAVFKSRPDLYAKYDAAHMTRSANAEGE